MSPIQLSIVYQQVENGWIQARIAEFPGVITAAPHEGWSEGHGPWRSPRISPLVRRGRSGERGRARDGGAHDHCV